MKNLKSLLALLCIIISITSCKKNDNDSNPSTELPDISVTIAGKVNDQDNKPIQGAVITAYGSSATTDAFGLFVIKDVTVNASRCIIEINKTGYVKQYYAFKPTKAGRTVFVKPVLQENGAVSIIASATGGVVSLTGGATVIFPVNAFKYAVSGASYTGNVEVRLNYLNQKDSMFSRKIPGRDLRALDKSNDEKILESFGMLNAQLSTPGGDQLQLADGKQATLTFPVADAMLAKAPATIPLWYFDETSALWKEEGMATKQGNSYVGNVSHFTWWNCDQPYPIATTTGVVHDCMNAPIANADVFAEYNYVAISDNMGEYSCDAPAQFPYAFLMNAEYYSATYSSYSYSQDEMIPVLTAGQVYNVPPLTLDYFTSNVAVSGNLVNCSGTATSGFVTVTYGTTLIDYTYTSTGSFSLIAYPSSSNLIAAYESGVYGSTAVNTSAPNGCNIVSIGNISMCNTVPVTNPNFNITLSGLIVGNQTLSYHVANCSVINNGTYYTIAFTGTDSINNVTANFDMKVPSYLAGNYNWNSTNSNVKINTYISGQAVVIETNLSSLLGSNVLTSAPAAGANVVSSFSGNVTVTSSSFGSMNGSIVGNFNILRLN